MPRIELEGNEPGEGGQWTPLPAGDYLMQIDSAEGGASKNEGKPQTLVKCHVVGGPNDGKNCVIFYSHSPKAIWKLRDLAEACGVDYELEELGRNDPETGKPQVKFGMDTDDLPGCTFMVTVKIGKNNTGEDRNEYVKERAPEGADDAEPEERSAQPSGQRQQAQQQQKPAQGATAGQASRGATPGRRTVRA